ncbi:hypothetical protein G7Y89_g10504 [Cudoniella acicularis]|uniref:Uncharacterized protein n=1 Tax=Cudoniella acicularis TaxID=354080 RepID=A0A8H4RCL5_9HELO|nr:hypothetical protein G7Y89_g10504 [Cudoniella acicularis]
MSRDSLRIAFAPVSGLPNEVWRLNAGNLETYSGQYAQQDPGANSEWIWVDTPANIAANGWQYIYFIINPVTLAVTARASGTGNTVLQVCNLIAGGVATQYLELAHVAGFREQTTISACYPVALKAIPLP